jgi:hypothetical protein
MARIRIIVEDDSGTEIEGFERVYELEENLDRLGEIEEAMERFKRAALPDLTAELLQQAQERAVADPKKERD